MLNRRLRVRSMSGMPSGRRVVRALVLGALAWVPLAFVGCGTEVYEERLENSKKLYGHMEVLDTHLHRDWVDADVGVRLRLPIQFSAMAASSAGAGASLGSGQVAPASGADDRQPKYMNLELPGLRGAFVAKLKIIAANAASANEDGFIYVLTNHHLANAREAAASFSSDLLKMLSQTLNVGYKPDDIRQAVYPQSVGVLAQPVQYKTVTLNPKEPIHGVERQFSVYMHEQSGIQTVILFVFPKDVDGVERLTDRLPLCLETLRVTGEKLAAPAGGASPTKAKAAGF